MLFTNILVPYDGSSNALHAFKVALDVAKKYDSKITLLTCLELDLQAPWYGYDARVGKTIMEKHKESIKKNLSRLESIAKKAKMSFNSEIVVRKSIVKTIVDFSKTHKIDLIIMGSHGRTGFDKLILGSVANGVSQKVKCPILIIK